MTIFDDVLSTFGDVVSDATDVVTSVIDRTPGLSQLKKLIVDQPIFGDILLTAIGSSLASAFANVALPSVDGMRTVGPVIASAAFAVPGMVAKGQDFVTAYVTDLTARTIATAAYFATGPGAAALTAQISSETGAAISSITQGALNSAAYQQAQTLIIQPLKQLVNDSGFKRQIDAATQKLITDAGTDLKNIASNAIKKAFADGGNSPEDIAKKFGVRPDVAALAINSVLGQNVYSAGDPQFADYDVLGNLKPGGGGPTGAPLPDIELAIAQTRLEKLGLLSPSGPGANPTVPRPDTAIALQSFQAQHNLPTTGAPDPATNQALGLAIVQQDLKTVPKPIGPQLHAVLTHTAVAASPAQPNIFGDLLKIALVTSPVWFPIFVWPKLRLTKTPQGWKVHGSFSSRTGIRKAESPFGKRALARKTKRRR